MPLKIAQLGIVVRDIVKSAEFYAKFFGIPPIPAIDLPPQTCELKGVPTTFTTQMGFGRLGDIQIELIHELKGPSPYSEFLAQGKEGLHHVGVYVEDLEVAIAQWAALGIGVYARGEIMGTKYAYMDTITQTGFMYELIQVAPPRAKKTRPLT